MSNTYLVSIDTGFAVFGVEVSYTDNKVKRTAPIGAYMKDWNYKRLISYLEKKNYKYGVFKSMSEVRKGTVQFANEKEYNGKVLYSVKLQGSNEYLNSGEKDPSLEPGDVVTITGTVTNGKFRAEPKDVVKEGKAEVTPTTKRSFRGGGKGNQVKEQYWELKQKMDLEMQPEYRYRSCVANAISFMKLLEDSNCLPITEANQSKPAKKFDAMLKLRKQLTIMLYDEMVAESKALNAKHLAIGDSSEKPEEFGCVETSTDEDTSEES